MLVSQVFYDKSSYNFNMSIGETIKLLRKEQGLSQTQLANLLFTSQDTISLWERDKSLPDATSIINMSIIFKTTTDEILCVAQHKHLIQKR